MSRSEVRQPGAGQPDIAGVPVALGQVDLGDVAEPLAPVALPPRLIGLPVRPGGLLARPGGLLVRPLGLLAGPSSLLAGQAGRGVRTPALVPGPEGEGQREE